MENLESGIQENSVETFRRLADKYITRIGRDSLMSWLTHETSFFEDPASTRFHLCEAGGLARHSLHVFYRLYALAHSGYVRDKEWPMDTIALVSLFHDLCKAGCYKPMTRNVKTYDKEKVEAAERWQRKTDNQGTFIWEAVQGYQYEDPFPYGHGEKSVYLLQRFVDVTDEEAMAIRWHMGFGSSEFKGGSYTINDAFAKYPLAVLLHMADFSATYLDETEVKT